MAGGWTAVDSGSWFFTSWVAEVGTLSGTLTPPDWLPPEADEIDYYVIAPTVTYDSLEDFDPSFGEFVAAYRYRSGGSEHTNTFGSYVPQPGDRVIVQLYTTDYPSDPDDMPQPSRPPLGMVKPSIVRGGYGPYRGGQWSDWQGPWRIGFFVPYSRDNTYAARVDKFGADAPSPTDGAAAFQAAIDDLRAGLGTDTTLSGGLPFEFFASGPGWSDVVGTDPTPPSPAAYAGGSAGMRYEAATFLGSTYQDTLTGSLPPGLPGDAGPIPSDEMDANTVDDLVQYESGSTTFDGWDDLTIPAAQMFAYDDDQTPRDGGDTILAGPSFVQPDVFDWLIGFIDPLAGALIGGISYKGPPLAWSDLTPLQHFARIGYGPTDRAPYAPEYSGGEPSVWDGADVVVDMSSVDQVDASVVLMPGYMSSDYTFPMATPQYAYDAGDFRWEPENFHYYGHLGHYTGTAIKSFWDPAAAGHGYPPVVRYMTPRWRYFILGDLIFPNPSSYVRFNQRSDGLGISGHPRLGASQFPSAPRVGGKNTYQ